MSGRSRTTRRPRRSIVAGPPAELQEGTLAAFEFSTNEPDAEFECAFVPADPSEPLEWSGCASPPENPAEFTQPAGRHTLLVRAVDSSMNADPTPAAYTWTVVGEPVTTIQTGPPASPDTTSERTATFTFAADQTGVDYKCSLDNAPFTGCESGVEYTNLALGEPLVRGPGDQPLRPRRGSAGEPRVDDRARARHDRAGDDDRLRAGRDQRERAGDASPSPAPTRARRPPS